MLSISQKIVIIIGISIFLFVITGFLIAFIFYYQKKRREYIRHQETMKNEFQRELLHTQLEIQEQTFKNISLEIHDNIGQSLSLAKLNLNTINLENLEVATLKLSNTKDLVSKAIIDLRDLSRSLNTDTRLSQGLIPAVRQELNMLEKAGSFQTELLVNGEMHDLDKRKELILFRIIQEAVNNAIKHSEASLIKIIAEFTNNTLCLRIMDNGKGFIDQPLLQEGSGLRNMKSRAELIGATFKILTNHNGTNIKITIATSDL